MLSVHLKLKAEVFLYWLTCRSSLKWNSHGVSFGCSMKKLINKWVMRKYKFIKLSSFKAPFALITIFMHTLLNTFRTISCKPSVHHFSLLLKLNISPPKLTQNFRIEKILRGYILLITNQWTSPFCNTPDQSSAFPLYYHSLLLLLHKSTYFICLNIKLNLFESSVSCLYILIHVFTYLFVYICIYFQN